MEMFLKVKENSVCDQKTGPAGTLWQTTPCKMYTGTAHINWSMAQFSQC